VSTLVLIALVARAATAQSPSVPTDTSSRPVWLSAGVGAMPGPAVSDKASNGGWHLKMSAPVTVALSSVLFGQTLGVRVQTAEIPMRFTGAACASCDGQVRALVALATYNRTTPLGDTPWNVEFEFGLGMTRWSGLRGRGSDELPAIGTVQDVSYAFSIGWSRVFSDRLDGLLMLDAVSATHAIGSAVVTGVRNNGQIALYALRTGARLRLGR